MCVCMSCLSKIFSWEAGEWVASTWRRCRRKLAPAGVRAKVGFKLKQMLNVLSFLKTVITCTLFHLVSCCLTVRSLITRRGRQRRMEGTKWGKYSEAVSDGVDPVPSDSPNSEQQQSVNESILRLSCSCQLEVGKR